ncbi:penicillin-binding protein [Aurantiacibacter xanthus]|uniref:peptidoglycan glycosyltransferase n=1 Tax=Aurantiacibacter xanthus TaxID=1784712 RepID=A0A3A1PDT7_9SPHN|nr:transglycosylase domain-containing protein [Aurantiacibacter xanthus]RIV90902.1 penicillin-binding protein [Aurantiacibacter xanthus]
MSDEHTMDEGSTSYRIRRNAGAAFGRLGEVWRDNRLVRLAGYALLLAVVLAAALWAVLVRDLPDAESLLDYRPNLPTVVRGMDGEIVSRYERERRVELQYKDLPPQLVNAYTSAEDKTFWSHGGIDAGGFFNAVIDYVSKLGSGQRAVGGSTITQQVAKNILVGNEYSVTRKLKEMILATRVESVLSKREIITLYLNEIPLGRRSFGVQAAARAYFNKDVDDLELHEMAYLAILPRAPEVYSRAKNFETALGRRNWVLQQMQKNGHISVAEMEAAQAKPLGIVRNAASTETADAGYFLEEVRRELIERYGEEAEDGPNSVYGGGLWVRTSLDTEMQDAARDALRNAILRYDNNRPWKKPIATVDPGDGDMKRQLASSYIGINYRDWRIAVVLNRSGGSGTVGFANGDEGPLAGALPDALKAGDIIAVSPEGNGWRLRAIPEVSGGFVAMSPTTGRVMAMQGGFDSRLGAFNRATQALRQPGSTIKPFVYATGLDNGMTPATLVPDRQYCYYQGANLGEKCFTNFGGSRGGGEYPMRYGLEQSKNLMTVHIAMDSGMENVIKTFENAGIADKGQYDPYPAFALGAGDTTVLKMVAAYSMMVNHGKLIQPSLIDYVQDRNGKVIWRSDERACNGCNMDEWDGKPMPRFERMGAQRMDPRTAFQIVHMLEGVVQRGTATRLKVLDMPLFGKTGTSSGPTNAWFVGGSPDIVAGTYLGFDQQSRKLGGYVQGGNTAAPIFLDFVKATRDCWSERPFIAPEGVRMVRIDRRSGRRVLDGWPAQGADAVIWEAFKPDTEPRRTGRDGDTIAAMRDLILTQLRRREQGISANQGRASQDAPGNFAEDQGGIY